MQQIGNGHVRVFFQRRIKFLRRLLELEQAFAVSHTEHRGHQAFADRPSQVWRFGGGRAGVAFVDQLAVADHQQGVGADALAGGVVAGWEGVILQIL
ncbi:hypothetical protein D3C85_884710 [compost metagenome]